MTKLHVATVASDTVWKEPIQNIRHTEAHVTRVMGIFPETQIILFPEISLMGFVTDKTNKDLAEPMSGRCVSEISTIAREKKVAIIASMIEAGNAKPYNTTFVINAQGEPIARYRKNHLFTESDEPEFFERGEELTTFDFEGWSCGLATCFDIRFPRLFETYRRAGVECVFSPFNWVAGRNKAATFDALVKARAHENQFFMVATDRSGEDPNTSYHGISTIANPYGENIAQKHGAFYSAAVLDKQEIATLNKQLAPGGEF